MIRFNKLLNRLKPRSTVWRTTLLVGSVVVISQYLSIAFFWTNLYLPELRQHAHYSAVHIDLLREAEKNAPTDPVALAIHDRVNKATGIEVVRDEEDFPKVIDKPFVEIFTTIIERQLSRELGEPVLVYFKFKPEPVFWIHVPSMQEVWVREPLLFFGQYNPWIIIAWLIGVPLLSLIAIVVLVRQLNRPLKRLQLAALRIGKGQHSTMLPTQSGPLEIRAVNRAFNQMTTQIQQDAKDRAFMLAGISHDLRTPLTRLRLTAEMMKEKDMAEGMVLDIQDMDAIIDQFIAYMRDGSDEEVEEACLDLLISEMVAQLSSQGPIDFTPGQVPNIFMKRLSLKRMLDNLISNALRYGGSPVHIHTTAGDKTVVMTVRDHGPGIDEADLPNLLQPFVRGQSARTSQGSGLGLAIVARIVRMHNGKLDIRNHSDGGLEVTITLPTNRRPGRA
ncbi:MAG: HAMP domain-containing protein [Moraxellaceae bacterium]|nr:HAMP domain-containing protein [Moraxellaceae bacterium]